MFINLLDDIALKLKGTTSLTSKLGCVGMNEHDRKMFWQSVKSEIDGSSSPVVTLNTMGSYNDIVRNDCITSKFIEELSNLLNDCPNVKFKIDFNLWIHKKDYKLFMKFINRHKEKLIRISLATYESAFPKKTLNPIMDNQDLQLQVNKQLASKSVTNNLEPAIKGNGYSAPHVQHYEEAKEGYHTKSESMPLDLGMLESFFYRKPNFHYDIPRYSFETQAEANKMIAQLRLIMPAKDFVHNLKFQARRSKEAGGKYAIGFTEVQKNTLKQQILAHKQQQYHQQNISHHGHHSSHYTDNYAIFPSTSSSSVPETQPHQEVPSHNPYYNTGGGDTSLK